MALGSFGNQLLSLNSSATGPTSQHVAAGAPVKHDPFLTFSGSSATISVRGTGGSMTALHPHSYPSHFIEAMWVTDQDGRVVHFVNSSMLSSPQSTFTIPGTATKLRPHEYCNLHGGLNRMPHAQHNTHAHAHVCMLRLWH